jgi:hypothetical protein
VAGVEQLEVHPFVGRPDGLDGGDSATQLVRLMSTVAASLASSAEIATSPKARTT